MLESIDYGLIVLYMLSLLFISTNGFRRRNKRREVEEFLNAGRSLGFFSTLTTINATKTGSILMIYTAMVYTYGLSAIWYFIGVSVGYLVFLKFSEKIFMISKSSSQRHNNLSDYYFKKYGRINGVLTSLFTLFILFGFLTMNLIASAKIFSFFLGWSFVLSAIVIAGVVTVYVMIGGYRAVVRTDVIQYVCIVLLLIVLLFPISTSSTINSQDINFLSASIIDVIGFFLIGLLLPFSASELWQRVYTVKDIKVLKSAMLASVGVYMIAGVILTLIALYVKSVLPLVDPDLALLKGFSMILPQGFLGLSVVVLFAATMSSIDSYLYSQSSILSQSLMRINETKIIGVLRILMIFLIFLSTFTGIMIADLTKSSFIFVSLAVIVAIPTIATWIHSSINSRIIMISLIFGSLFFLIFMIKGLIENNLTPEIIIMALIGGLLGLVLGWVLHRVLAFLKMS